MVPQGASPHVYEPTPSQIKALEEADLYLALGSGIEFENRWIEKIHGMYPLLPFVNLSEDITLLPGSGEVDEDGDVEAIDPHIWLSLSNSASIVNTTTTALSGLNADKSANYESNRDQYLLKLNQLKSEISSEVSNLKSKEILVYHPAFGYFCKEFGLSQVSVEKDGKETSGQQLAALIDQCKKDGITVIFTEPEESSSQAETIANAINGTVVLISPLETNYLENMQNIAEKIQESSSLKA